MAAKGLTNWEQAPPYLRRLHEPRVRERSLDELLGLCKGCLADGVVNQLEAEFLFNWLKVNDNLRDEWPASVLWVRLNEYLEDGVLDENEREELLDVLRQTAGDGERFGPASKSTALCFDDPLPSITFDTTRFCFTGQFAYGSRRECEMAVRSLGGDVLPNPVIKGGGCILVVGTLASREWKHGNFGTKIMKAMDYRDKGHPIHIIPEDHWANQIVEELDL